eukprot:TRINITY_DN67973_c0_g1_i1.p1 TRINITY_DN67973_c0_g1~~TRINITY_DN67973_c0_g1_i1.p1  ORF type:complete len:283 (+),score=37.42 TRINITY_DN67973_c0_g1_i1:126-851(+)
MGEESEIEEPNIPKGPSPNWAIPAVCFILLVPAIVLSVKSWQGQLTCDSTYEGCLEYCKTTYSLVPKKFMSQQEGEQNCIKQCEADVVKCRSTAILLVIAAILLLIAICCTVGLLHIVELMRDPNDALGEMRVRASASEPILTEEQRLAKEEEERKRCLKLISFLGYFCICCRQSFINMLYISSTRVGIVPEADPPKATVKARCRRCDITFDVDSRWLSSSMSAEKGAACPKCYYVVLGII